MPDFSLSINKGYLTLTTRTSNRLLAFSGKTACNDGNRHDVQFTGDAFGITVWLDGVQEFSATDVVPYCNFGYVGFATIGRGVLVNQFQSYFEGTLFSIELSQTPYEPPTPHPVPYPKKIALFERGMCDSENFRIPTLITLPNGTVIASADARKDAPGDSPNHICRAVRISKDSGETWSEPLIVCDFGGYGRADGAAAIDGSMVYDNDTKKVLMFFLHTPATIGSPFAQPGTGYNVNGEKNLTGQDGKKYVVSVNDEIIDTNGVPSGYSLDSYHRILKNGEIIGSACHGKNRLFCIDNTTFLHYIESSDYGETWSAPHDINPHVKAEWMRFMLAGPGNGIQIQNGAFKGRLVMPTYFGNEACLASSGAFYSDDHGKTWHRGESVNDERFFEGRELSAENLTDPRACLGECQLTELSDGRIKIFVRNTHYRRVISALSDNGGESWHSASTEPQLLESGCQSHVLRAQHDGKPVHLFSNPAHESLRIKGTLRYSDDDTRTFSHSRLLESGEFGYSCMAQLPDGQIGVLYEGLDITQFFTKMPIAWILGEPT